MLSKDVTWGELRALHQLNVRSGGGITDDILADPEELAKSKGKADDDYYFDLTDEEIAQSKALKAEFDYDNLPGTVSVTISRTGEVLELIKVLDSGILLIRTNKKWVEADSETEIPRVHEQTLADVSEDFVEYYDRLREAGAEITKEVMQDYAI